MKRQGYGWKRWSIKGLFAIYNIYTDIKLTRWKANPKRQASNPWYEVVKWSLVLEIGTPRSMRQVLETQFGDRTGAPALDPTGKHCKVNSIYRYLVHRQFCCKSL